MSQAVLSDVFTVDELVRATGADAHAVRRLITSGELQFIPGTSYVSGADAVRAGRRLRELNAGGATAEQLLVPAAAKGGALDRRPGMPAIVSSLVHAAIVAAIIWSSAGPAVSEVVAEPPRNERLVFLMTPGPGGGGGGGGLRNPLPAPRLQRRTGVRRTRVAVPEVTPKPVVAARREPEPVVEPPPAPAIPAPVERPPDPPPAPPVAAPVVASAPDPRDVQGVIERPVGTAESQGAGTGGGSGTGTGSGSGEGLGSGIGDGSGGGTGGGPFRPGSGIEPPRLLREVKPEYTDEARRRGITGEVVLEVVVQRDGSVGDVRLKRGLGSGLDQRAIAAVRQWRFSAARRQNVPVDVLVEVAVEFTLR